MLMERDSTKTKSSCSTQGDVVCSTTVTASVGIVVTMLTIVLGVVVSYTMSTETQLATVRLRLATVEREAKEAHQSQQQILQRLAKLEKLDDTHDGRAQEGGVGPLVATHPSKRSLQEQEEEEEECLSTDDMSRLAVKTAFAVNENHEQLYALVNAKADSLDTEAAEASRLASGCIASLTEPATTCTPPADGLVVTGCTVASGV